MGFYNIQVTIDGIEADNENGRENRLEIYLKNDRFEQI